MPRPLVFLLLLSFLGPFAHGAPLWIAIGYEGRRLVSADGTAWREIPSTTTAPLRAIACDGQRFLATGGTAAASLALSTSDGEHWQEWPAAPGEIATITAGHGRFVAVRGGRLLSAAGAEDHFTEGEVLPFAGEIYSLHSACGDTEAGFRYVVIGELASPDGAVPWRAASEDGLHWVQTARDTAPARALAYGSGLFVIAGPNGLLETSHDGQLWTRRELGAPDDIETLLWTGEKFIAQGKRLQTSADGFTWHLEPDPPPGRFLWGRAPHPILALSWTQQLLAGDLQHWTALRVPAGPPVIAIARREDPASQMVQDQMASIAKWAVEWLLVDPQENPKSGEAPIPPNGRWLLRLRAEMRARKASAFPVEIVTNQSTHRASFTYNRETKSIAAGPYGPPNRTKESIYVTMDENGGTWHLSIETGAWLTSVQIERRSGIWCVSKVGMTEILD